MKRDKSIVQTFFFSVLFVAILVILTVGLFWVYRNIVNPEINTNIKSWFDYVLQIKALELVFISLFGVVISVIISRFISLNIQNSFKTFNDFFYKAAHDLQKIDENSLRYKEFKELAKSVNYMIDNYTEQKKRLEIEASTDPLTKIANRLKFDTVFVEHSELAKRYGDTFSLILFDVDNFKTINDTFGHKVGDNVLVALARLVNKEIRKSDTFARWGGEEFVILAPQADLEQTIILAEKLRSKIEEYDFKEIGKLTCSFGVAEFKNGCNLKELVKCADDVLYKAKRSGKNRVYGYTKHS